MNFEPGVPFSHKFSPLKCKVGGLVLVVLAGTMKSVTLCGGRLLLITLEVTLTSASLRMAFVWAAVICQTWAVDFPVKLVIDMSAGV